ncbi:hypothetical protein ACI3KW_05705 [Devosia sp. ZW T5_3]|uniref:hypothetical protein n=1 Tax=Devosia sp. ZW T5_3 TaxID=3378085 RepID=UPI0038527FAA
MADDVTARLKDLSDYIHVDIPLELTSEREKSLYRTFYLDNPSAHAMTKTVEPLLVNFVREKLNSDYLSERIEELKLDPSKSGELLKFMRAQATSTSTMTTLLVKLKATPSATVGYRGGQKTVETKEKPWEFGMTPEEIAESRRKMAGSH